jgi:hypothetical protein
MNAEKDPVSRHPAQHSAIRIAGTAIHRTIAHPPSPVLFGGCGAYIPGGG